MTRGSLSITVRQSYANQLPIFQHCMDVKLHSYVNVMVQSFKWQLLHYDDHGVCDHFDNDYYHDDDKPQPYNLLATNIR